MLERRPMTDWAWRWAGVPPRDVPGRPVGGVRQPEPDTARIAARAARHRLRGDGYHVMVGDRRPPKTLVRIRNMIEQDPPRLLLGEGPSGLSLCLPSECLAQPGHFTLQCHC